jgi:hypothetical protein
MSEVIGFFKDVNTGFQQSKTKPKTMNKKDIEKIMPKNLLMPPKLKLLTTYKDEITERQFVKLLRLQTDGSDYVNFGYIIDYYKLETDKNDMIIFTDKFPFNNRIKKEALFIWGILNTIKRDKILGKFQNYIIKDLQTKFTINLLNGHSGYKFDLCFKSLNIAVEIDENHTSDNVKENDENKTAMLKLNGYNLTRLDFQEINQGSTIVDNINDIIYNNKYYSEFITTLKNKILSSLLHKYVDVREFYIMYMYKQSIGKKIHEFNEIKNDNSRSIDICTNNCKNATSSNSYKKNYNLLEKMEGKKKIIKKLYDDYNKLLSDTNTESNDSDFKKLFKLKNKCRDADYTNVITFNEIANLLNFKPVDYKDLTTIIYTNGIIKYDDLPYETINITWKQLSVVISDYNDAKDLQKLLMSYYIEIEESYEKIIIMINKHTESISGNEFVYKMCMQYIINKNASSDRNKICKLTNENIKLISENKAIMKEIIFLKDVNESYMKMFTPVKVWAAHDDIEGDYDDSTPIIEYNSESSGKSVILETPQEFATRLGLKLEIQDVDSSDINTDVDTDKSDNDDY